MEQPTYLVGAIIRERWLPFVVEIAQRHHWQLNGQQCEQLVDQLAPYLAHPDIIRPGIATALIHNYYRDAAMINLLCAEQSEAGDAAWAFISQVLEEFLFSQLSNKSLVDDRALHERILQKLHHELQQYTFQSSLAMVLSRIIRREVVNT